MFAYHQINPLRPAIEVKGAIPVKVPYVSVLIVDAHSEQV